MKQGKSLEELAIELKRVRASARDLIVPTEAMSMKVLDEKPMLYLNEGHVFEPTQWSHQQIASFSDIPKSYYDRVNSENPGLLSTCVNHGFAMAVQKALLSKRSSPSRMLRTIDGKVRGFLSSRYRRLDCADLLDATLPSLLENDFEVVSSEFTEKRMYLKAKTPKIEGEVKPGMVVQYGITISSSDVGAGSILVQPLLYELVCSNGMIMESSIRKFHIGRELGGSDSIEELLTDQTKDLSDRAFWSSVVDVVENTMNPEVFNKQLNLLRDASEQKIENFDIPEVVDLSMKEVGVSGDSTKKSIINYIANGADGRGLNKWALANAFTWAAQSDDLKYENATELERAGGKIIELPKNRWKVIAQ